MSGLDPKLAEMEAEDLKVHVVADYERYSALQSAIQNVDSKVERNHNDVKADIGELKKIVIWSASTLFGTMIIALFTNVFKSLGG